jgi:hypothetical protein
MVGICANSVGTLDASIDKNTAVPCLQDIESKADDAGQSLKSLFAWTTQGRNLTKRRTKQTLNMRESAVGFRSDRPVRISKLRKISSCKMRKIYTSASEFGRIHRNMSGNYFGMVNPNPLVISLFPNSGDNVCMLSGGNV